MISAQGINFFEGSFDEVKAEAKKQNKIIFIDCYTSWCGPCKWMSKNVFPDFRVGEFYNANFISYKLDMEKGDGKEVRKTYSVNAFPTLLFINAEGEIENRSLGACDTAEFIKIGKRSLDRENNFGALLRKYKNGDRSPEFLYKYALACANINVPYDIKEYFITQKDSGLLSEKNFVLMEWYLTDIHSREFLFLTSHRKEFSDLMNKERVDGRIIEIIRKNLVILSGQKNSKPVPEASREMIRPFHFADSSAFELRVMMHYYSNGKNHDWARYEDYSGKYLSMMGTDKVNPSGLLKIIQNISNYSDDTIYLRKALTWSEPLISASYQLPDTYFSLAKIYKKLADNQMSEQFAEKALAEEQKKTVPVIKDIQKFIKELDETQPKK